MRPQARLAALSGPPTLLWLPPGPLQAQLASQPLPSGLRMQALPWLPQTDFDHLLAAADLALVRGEDSFVRAQLVGRGPVLWQIYPQSDGAHGPKLDAWMGRLLAGAPPPLAAAVRRVQRVVNGLETARTDQPLALPELTAWAAQQRRWQAGLHAQADLVTQLLAFAGSRMAMKSG